MSNASGYTPEFKARVRKEYTREVHPELDDILEGRQHAWDLGKLLKEGSIEYTITSEQIVETRSTLDLQMLRVKALMIINRKQLYEDWLDNAPGVNISSQDMAKEWIAEKQSIADSENESMSKLMLMLMTWIPIIN